MEKDCDEMKVRMMAMCLSGVMRLCRGCGSSVYLKKKNNRSPSEGLLHNESLTFSFMSLQRRVTVRPSIPLLPACIPSP